MRTISSIAAAAIGAAAMAGATAQAAVPTSPDGRAYERITSDGTYSPPDAAAVSDDGTRVAFRWAYPLPEADNGFVSQEGYVAQRSTRGWSVGEMAPSPAGQRPPEPAIIEPGDLRALVYNQGAVAAGLDAAVWRRELDGSLTELLRVPAPSPTSPSLAFEILGASADLSRVFVYTKAQLLPEALPAPSYNIYEISAGGLQLVSRAPGMPGAAISATAGSVDAGDPVQPDAVSRDGSVVIFQDQNDVAHPVYARVDGTHTIDVSASQRTSPDPNGVQGRSFQAASSDGKHIVFMSAEELTDDAATNGGAARELYQYDLDSGHLRTITPGFGTGVSPDVLGVAAMAQDASRIYFVAKAALPGSAAVDGESNLYRYDTAADSVRFIATLDSTDQPGSVVERYRLANATPDGRRVVFLSHAPLTGSASTDSGGGAHLNVFLYDDDSGDLTCLSCGGPGTHVVDDSAFTLNAQGGNVAEDQGVVSVGTQVQMSMARVMSDDGHRIFFTTRNALVPQDVNGRWDVYEYENGKVHLVSPGDGPYDARFEGSSSSGKDVVFATDQPLAASDDDVASDLYDARVGGGFQQPASPAAPCSGDACQGAPTPQVSAPVAASIAFTGPSTVDLGRAPAAVPRSKPAKLRVTRKVLGASSLRITVKAPAAGRVSVSGAGVVTARRTLSAAASSTLPVRLTRAARQTLRGHHRLGLRLRVGYLPKVGLAQSMTVTLVLKG